MIMLIILYVACQLAYSALNTKEVTVVIIIFITIYKPPLLSYRREKCKHQLRLHIQIDRKIKSHLYNSLLNPSLMKRGSRIED